MTQDWKRLYEKKQAPIDEYETDERGSPIQYSEKAMDHFVNPRNVGRIENWDGFGCFGDPACGDSLEMTIRLKQERIVEIGFMVYGCAGAIATSSMVTELAKGKTLSEAARIRDDDVIRALDGLPESKQHCSLLGVEALRLAIIDTMVMRHCISEGLVKDAQDYREKRQEGRLKYDPNQFLKGGRVE